MTTVYQKILGNKTQLIKNFNRITKVFFNKTLAFYWMIGFGKLGVEQRL